MSEDQDQRPELDPKQLLISEEKLEKIIELAKIAIGGLETIKKENELRAADGSMRIATLQYITDELVPILTKIAEDQEKLSLNHDKLRAVMLGKMEGLQGTMDIVRQDVRNAWTTADFAITDSRNTREENDRARDETDKILRLISTMQTQHQLLASQVEVLKRAAAEKNGA